MSRSVRAIQPEYRLAHRLTGAVIIVGMTVVISSMLLTEPGFSIDAAVEKQAVTNDTQVAFQSKVAPLSVVDEETANVTSGKSETSNPPSPSAPEQDNQSAETVLVMTRDAPDETPSKDVVSPEPAAVTGDTWRVQVGTFAKSVNAETMIRLLNKNGFSPKHATFETGNGTATRIWLGPYQGREKADVVSDQLKQLTGDKGYVTPQTS